jgi:hypothetical protein
MKKIIFGLLFTATLFSANLFAGRGGSAAFGAFGGSMVGSVLGSAMTKDRSPRTVIVREPAPVTVPRASFDSEQDYKIKMLEEMILNLRREVENLRYEVRQLRDK